MKILSYDCFSGISGDMNLGAMIDLGVDIEYLRSELQKLRLKGWDLLVEKDHRHGIKGTKVTVRQTIHEHAHRHLADIKKIVEDSTLDKATRELSMSIFMKIAIAEAAVHGTTIDHVHFHEVGAIDSIIDVVGAAICYNALGIDRVHLSALELGGGFVNCDHGKLPVPAPATSEIVKGMPANRGGVDFEATTPTGAAILATLVTDFSTAFNMKIEKTAYGIGHKDHPSVPNLLRVFIGEASEDTGPGHDALLLQCNIDDMNPEFYDHISEKLFQAGIADVYLTNIIMKKGRPGIILNVICETEHAGIARKILFTESSTLGIRTFPFRKDTLSRKFEIVSTEFGDMRIKISSYLGQPVSVKPEYDDCRKIASEMNIPLKKVYNEVQRVAELKLKNGL
jgi:uncharacterized protein (TIGR00299 family) protein